MRRAVRLAHVLTPALFAFGCAKIPPDQYGIERLRLHGVERLNPEALRGCLATQERAHAGIDFGRGADPECGVPPFDGKRVHLRLWVKRRKAWPLFDLPAFERDIERIERWYRARGYYDARVTQTTLTPSSAQTSDQVPETDPPCTRRDEDEGCTVSIDITIDEGEPTLVQSVELVGIEELDEKVQEKLREGFRLREGAVFDEVIYDRSKQALVRVLADASYARAQVGGHVEIDAAAHSAHIRVEITPGPPCTLGEIVVAGQGNLSTRPILGAAFLRTGMPFSQAALEHAQESIYALGAFSSVAVEAVFPEDAQSRAIDVLIRVTPGRLTRLGAGGGIEAGSGELLGATPIWDVHLLGFAEHRNFLGGLRRARIELRPKLVFGETFAQWWGAFGAWTFGPSDTPSAPKFGNEIRLDLTQPAFIERRTTLLFSARHDFGPDPFQLRHDADGSTHRVFRHDLLSSLGPSRDFFGGKLTLSGKLWANLFLINGEDRKKDPTLSSDFHLVFFEPRILVDLRDDARSATRGFFFLNSLQMSLLLPGSWDYLRWTGDVRGYVPLPLGLVIAGRFALGATEILTADSALDAESEELGPVTYRLRGGGATSVRGYLPGELGDSLDGGLRSWEASLELRVPITAGLSAAMFGDMGDVYRRKRYRFEYAHTSFGGGLRYATFIGILRLDVGWRVPGAQILGERDSPRERGFPGSVHFAFGESF